MEAANSIGMRNGARALNLVLMLAAAGLVLATVVRARGQAVVGVRSVQPFPAAIRAGRPDPPRCRAGAPQLSDRVVLAAVALVHGWAIKDLWLGGTASAALSGMNLRVVSANVWAINPTPDEVLAFIRASDADLVVLVDARSRRWRQVLSELAHAVPLSGAARAGGSGRRSSCSAAIPWSPRRWCARRGVGGLT